MDFSLKARAARMQARERRILPMRYRDMRPMPMKPAQTTLGRAGQHMLTVALYASLIAVAFYAVAIIPYQ